jgi:hypothetical protein
MSSTTQRQRRLKKNGFRSSQPPGIQRLETFVMKSMDRNSSLLKLKLDLVYRDLAIEEAQKRFDELNLPTEGVVAAAPAEPAVVALPKTKKKVVRALVPEGQAPKRVMSDAARAAASERMKKFHADKKAEVEAHRAAIRPKAVLPADK